MMFVIQGVELVQEKNNIESYLKREYSEKVIIKRLYRNFKNNEIYANCYFANDRKDSFIAHISAEGELYCYGDSDSDGYKTKRNYPTYLTGVWYSEELMISFRCDKKNGDSNELQISDFVWHGPTEFKFHFIQRTQQDFAVLCVNEDGEEVIVYEGYYVYKYSAQELMLYLNTIKVYDYTISEFVEAESDDYINARYRMKKTNNCQ